MLPPKSYIVLIFACLLNLSLALPMQKHAARHPEPAAPVADQFGGGGGGSGADW
ncbi:hypothetical protein P692DRAFT_20825761 [Suillus brevipes Sb2]|nr:hypothetical protein P692DRAFT_20825761 [Suillus brevipes Sb2]